MRKSVHKSSKSIYFAIALTLSFLLFQYFPVFGFYTREAWLGVMLLLSVPLLFKNINYRHSFYTSYKVYVYLVIGMGLITSFSAWRLYGQPVYFGMLTQRAFLVSFAGLAIIELYRRGAISIRNIRDGFIIVSWLMLFINLILFLFVSPREFADFAGFAGGRDATRYYFHYQLEPLVFLFLYAFLKIVHQGQMKYLIPALLTFSFISLIAQKRAAFFALVLVCIFHFLKSVSLGKILVAAQWAALLLFVSVFGLYLYDANFLLNTYDKFNDAVVVITTGQLTADDSANTRILQYEIAKGYIDSNPFFGNGRISGFWRDGYQTFINYRFFPSDMGFLGATYVYGYIGVAFMLGQFIFPYTALRVSRENRKYFTLRNSEPAIFLESIVLFVAYLFVYGIMHATFFFDPGKVLILSAVIFCVSVYMNKLSLNGA